MNRLGFQLKDFLDDVGSQDSIRQRMRDLIESADLCIADLTESNPQVFFEYGLRRGTGRPVLAFIKQGDKLKYDVDDYYTEPYQIEDPDPAIEAIEVFAQRAGLGQPTLRADVVREHQTERLRTHIAERKPRRVDILHVALVAIKAKFEEILWQSPETIVRVLLLHPDSAAKYGEGCREDVLAAVKLVKSLPEKTRNYRPTGTPCSTVGLWFYKHEPGVSAVIVDDELVQLGWYCENPCGIQAS